MNPAEIHRQKFEFCWDIARQIVAAYRAEAPEDCDPQNSGVAIATLVIGAGTAAYSANEQKKATKEANAAIQGREFEPVKYPGMPDFIPVDLNQLQRTVRDYDRGAYRLSDKNFQRRHAPIVAAEKLFEQQVLKDQQGESELMPAVQNEFMRAGIANALSSFGDAPGTLAPGSAGEAAVARNLGISILGFQDRNRANRERSLLTAEQIFPRRSFGLSGAEAGQVLAANIAGQNNWNQAEHAANIQELQFNATGGMNFANAQQSAINGNNQMAALANAEQAKAILSAVEMAGKLYTNNKGKQAGTTSLTTTPTAAAA